MKTFVKLLLLLLLVTLSWQLMRTFFSQQEQSFRTEIRETFKNEFKEQAKVAQSRFGMTRLHKSSLDAPHVLLIHGLDDPGKVWMNLAPALAGEDYNLWQMTYPNDQPISLSAAEFRTELSHLHASGVGRVTIVAHSMGGLVTREVLTNPDWQCRMDQCLNGPVPQVEKLIMVGTPNHGSELARFRFFAEIREQAARALTGEAAWLDWIFDGAGEAGIDLIPGSEFLLRLNGRPHPRETQYFVIAGVIGDEERQQLKRKLAKPEYSEALSVQTIDALSELTDTLLEGIGDGLVTLESAKLQGVPLQVVPGTHLSIIRNISESSERVPPAIPIILGLMGGQKLPEAGE